MVGGTEPEASGGAVEDCREDAGAIGPRHALAVSAAAWLWNYWPGDAPLTGDILVADAAWPAAMVALPDGGLLYGERFTGRICRVDASGRLRKRPLVIFDEAHLLDNALMEAVRMLTNRDMDSGAPFAALLIGPPQRLRLGVLAALDQRISVRYALAGMNAKETADYITHHLKIAGRRTDTLFSTDSITLIHNASRGYPRTINNLAVNALTAAFARDSPIVDEKAASRSPKPAPTDTATQRRAPLATHKATAASRMPPPKAVIRAASRSGSVSPAATRARAPPAGRGRARRR